VSFGCIAGSYGPFGCSFGGGHVGRDEVAGRLGVDCGVEYRMERRLRECVYGSVQVRI